MYPAYKGWERDYSRLALLSKTRGLGLFTHDLPSLDRLLVAGLERGRLTPKGPLTSKVSKGVLVPKFLSGLWLRIFDSNACLLPDADSTAIALLRQIFCLGKRLVAECTPSRVQRTVEEYHNVESEVAPYSLQWEKVHLDTKQESTSLHLRDVIDGDNHDLLDWFRKHNADCTPASIGRLRVLLLRAQLHADAVVDLFKPFEATQFSGVRLEERRKSGFKHGPGAVSDRPGKGIDKYTFLNWPEKLQARFPYEACGNTASNYGPRPGYKEVPSKLVAVPKTAEKPRLIASEPTEFQWCQQLMKTFLEEQIYDVVGRQFIDFRDQEASRKLARLASLERRLATVDLSSASDRLSCMVVERVFRRKPSILHSLHACRTSRTIDPISNPPREMRKRKFASQGTAVTFPVQTLIFWILAMASLPGWDLKKKMRRFRGEVRVFGDDIILPSTGYTDLILLLHALGLRVNTEKSFVNGAFRESCGGDYWDGHNVAPIKPQRIGSDDPQSRAAMVDLSNNLHKAGWWRAAEAVRSKHPANKFMPVVGLDDGVVGWASFTGPNYSHLYKRRMNNDYQYEEVFVYRITGRTERNPTDGRSALLQYFTEDPTTVSCVLQRGNWNAGMALRSTTRDGRGWVELPGGEYRAHDAQRAPCHGVRDSSNA